MVVFGLGWPRGLLKQQTGTGGPERLQLRQFKQKPVGGKPRRRILVGFKEILANHLTTQEGKARLGSGCVQPGGELLTQTGDIVERWKAHFEGLLNPTNT